MGNTILWGDCHLVGGCHPRWQWSDNFHPLQVCVFVSDALTHGDVFNVAFYGEKKSDTEGGLHEQVHWAMKAVMSGQALPVGGLLIQRTMPSGFVTTIPTQAPGSGQTILLLADVGHGG